MMSNEFIEKVIKDYKQSPIEHPLCVTFTVKQSVHTPTPFGLLYRKVTQTDLRRNFRHFMNRLNQTYFGNSFRRFNKKLKVFNVEQYSKDGRLHLHTILQIPQNITVSDFKNTIREIWSLKTEWGYKEFDFMEPNDHLHFGGEYGEVGWLKYSIRQIQIEENFITKSSSVDWENTFH